MVSVRPRKLLHGSYYANKIKKHNIKYWQIGNEMDDEWEIGGPVNAFTYAEKFIKFSKAMKAVDQSIRILGPLSSGIDKLSGEYDNRTWLESTIFKIGEAEKNDLVTYLDGIDFHIYPYWTYGTRMFFYCTFPRNILSLRDKKE